jgi:4a-hydroxytetrahydrobiopterin dehydratase
MERKLLTPDEIADAGLNEWMVDDKMLKRKFKFDNFAASLAFVNRVGEIAESLDHHPDITFGWGYADIATTTHDRGGITDFDLELARRIDAI